VRWPSDAEGLDDAQQLPETKDVEVVVCSSEAISSAFLHRIYDPVRSANLWRLRDHNAAYRNIPFEKEAYERERDCDRGRV
jgi:hypothetical protein